MSMTESETLGMLRAKLTCMELEDLACIEKGCDKDCDNCNYCYEQGNRGQSKEALSVAISALEEVQKIKELGDCYIIPKNGTWEVNGIDIHKALEEIQQYRAIGTVSEFRELKEKAMAKKPRFYAHNYHCTECGNLVGNNEFHWQRFEYCDKCGQKLDWSEGKENKNEQYWFY
mgnify:CR=1 FL=1